MLTEYLRHHNTAPDHTAPSTDVLGGLIHEYRRAARDSQSHSPPPGPRRGECLGGSGHNGSLTAEDRRKAEKEGFAETFTNDSIYCQSYKNCDNIRKLVASDKMTPTEAVLEIL
ncbi:hypothetical protein [Virgisporangium aurantiacum]|uniref:Uncharacterized protein n=1 Tax=Virgisporangium aurantiacum TaxID=175570 RepID=A0A8J3ZL72_9ACTN|nr:hypothetical protein [Virgisporangium aurantiacum]GIJ63518.1 hypothetical protein Vau01_110340 [Virgisporangium aurantiacum]